MELRIFAIITGAFVIGGLALWLAKRKTALRERKKAALKYMVHLAVNLVFSAGLFFGKTYLFILSGMLLFIMAAELIRLQYKNRSLSFGRFLFILIVFGLSAYFWMLLILCKSAIFFVLLFLTVSAFDGFSQVSGQLFGKKKITSRISPGKTLGGFLSGWTFSVLAGLILFWYGIGSAADMFVHLIFVGLYAFTGDIFASSIKRYFDVKDFSRILPGHGGMFDRFDSFLFTSGMFGLIFYCNYV